MATGGVRWKVQLLADWIDFADAVWPPRSWCRRAPPGGVCGDGEVERPQPGHPGAAIVIQATVLTGVHAQLEPVVTPMLLLRPVDSARRDMGDTLKVQLLADCGR